MADQNTSLPVRSQADGNDERVHSKLVDFADPSGTDKQMEVSEKLAHVRAHGADPGGTKRQLKLSEAGKVNGDGDYDGTSNTEPNSAGLIAHDRGATIDETSQNKRVTAVAGADNTVCLDVAIRDEAGQAFSGVNPLPVTFEASEGDEVHDYKAASAIAKDAVDNHDYQVTAAKTLQLQSVLISASGKLKAELQIEDGVAAGTYTTRATVFNSTANPNAIIPLVAPIEVAAQVKVRIAITNRDNQAQDLYSTIIGVEA